MIRNKEVLLIYKNGDQHHITVTMIFKEDATVDEYNGTLDYYTNLCKQLKNVKDAIIL